MTLPINLIDTGQRLFTNLFQPSFKLKSSVREGGLPGVNYVGGSRQLRRRGGPR